MNRSAALARLGKPIDVLVIGGGATGLGIAVDSATRGYRTLLVEAHDFAQGTSSRSTKLIHGGVRYLEQGNISLVRDALRERAALLRNAPHLVHQLRFLIPAYRWWQVPYYGAGLKMYDLMSGGRGTAPARLLSSSRAGALVPTLQTGGLRGGVLYSDGQFDDARLAISLARTAVQSGATVLNHMRVETLHRTRENISGAQIRDQVDGTIHDVQARVVINATGIFTDELRALDEVGSQPMLTFSQGVHLILPREFLPGETAILIPRTDDGRVVFLIPWHNRTLLGTTDTPVPRASIDPVAFDEEIQFLLEHAARYLTHRPERSDILSISAGIRPLVRDRGLATSTLSRDHVVRVSNSGLVTITGGKWTTYRRMAQDAVDCAVTVGALPHVACRTAALPLFGAGSVDPQWRPIGARAEEIAKYEERFPGNLHPNLPYSLAMAAYTIENEMPVKVQDILSRRLRALLLDARAALAVAPQVALLMAQLQGHDQSWVQTELEDFTQLVQQSIDCDWMTV